MKTIKIDKPYSWLQWPVFIDNYEGKPLHVTAKFFGSAPMNWAAVRSIVRQQSFYTIRNLDFEWAPVMFNVTTPTDLVHVLELKKYPPAIPAMHDAFDLIEDQFRPYRPHIAVHRSFWSLVAQNNLTALGLNLNFGEIELYMGNVQRD